MTGPYYKGKPVAELSREELEAALQELWMTVLRQTVKLYHLYDYRYIPSAYLPLYFQQ